MTAAKAILENQFVRVKACRHGLFAYWTGDVYIGRSLDCYGEFAEAELDLLGQMLRPGQVALDIGANIGVHTVFLAQKTGPQGIVVAIEPQRLVHQLLDANVALNALTNVRTERLVLGASAGETKVPLLNPARELNFGGLEIGQWDQGETTTVSTLDALDLPACHLIKMDVEGMELDVLRGGEQRIRESMPIIYLENDRPGNSVALIQCLMQWGYRLYWHVTPLFNPGNFFGRADNVFGAIVSANMLAIPARANQNIKGLTEITQENMHWHPIGGTDVPPGSAAKAEEGEEGEEEDGP